MIGFWIFMLVLNLTIPITIFIIGNIFIKESSKDINHMFSYKTSMAMKNKETWEFAHIHFGKLWRIFGVIMLPISIAFMFYIYGEDINTVGLYGMIFCLLQCGIISIPIIFTEIALNKKFDKNGDRRFL